MKMQKVKESIEYEKPNSHLSTYDIVEVNGVRLSVDNSEYIFAEKYRPRILEDLILPENIMKQIESNIKQKKIPNILFYSLQGGSGKDSIISVLRNQIPMNLHTINGAQKRGIDAVRGEAETFVNTRSHTGERNTLYVTELGNMSKIAIDSLKPMVENYSNNNSFFISTNMIDNISQPLMSRFQLYDLNTIPSDERKILAKKVYLRLKAILDLESIEYEDVDIAKLVKRYFPSYRELINQTEMMIVDGKLDITSNETSLDDLNAIFQAINSGDYETVAAKSEVVDVRFFASYCNSNYKKMIQSKDFGDFWMALNELQQAINSSHAFLNISLCVFAVNLMNSQIKFKILT